MNNTKQVNSAIEEARLNLLQFPNSFYQKVMSSMIHFETEFERACEFAIMQFMEDDFRWQQKTLYPNLTREEYVVYEFERCQQVNSILYSLHQACYINLDRVEREFINE